MGLLEQLKRQYGTVDCRDLGSRQLEQLRDGLKGVTPEEVSSSEDGKTYIELLKKFREAVAENDKLHGENYPVLLHSLLSVGEDGLYSNDHRFIFELIQNVDDCDYRTYDDCKLDMRFDFNEDKIILTYNEVGFTPFNVFAITGIAEAAKNISSSKNEIGEKGIGFKSVFGVARKVLVRSGWFSFELYKENFTIPVPSYSSMDYCPGTVMTLFVPGKAKQIYKDIRDRYCSKDALFSKNPLLFLNKLTSLKIYYDAWRSMEFHVSRSGLSKQDNIEIERDVEISVDLHDYEKGKEVDVKEQIRCSRYSYPVVFSRKACQSRYGEQTKVGDPDGKTMILRVVLPNPEYLSDVGMGSLYSFLPTQLKLTVPLVCHVPFKLDASREFVDSQNENLWFQEASRFLGDLIDQAYMDWRTVVKENIVQYIPGSREYLFAHNNGKEQCLKQEDFSGAHYLNLPLFLTMEGGYHRAGEIICFDQEDQISEPEKVYRLMGFKNFLFVPSSNIRKLWLNTERNLKNRLFQRALSVPALTAEILDYLDSTGYTYSEKQIPEQESLTLTGEQVEILFKRRRLASLLQTLGCSYVKKNMRLKFVVSDSLEQDIKDVLYESFDLSETPRQVEKYMRFCNGKCICLDIAEDSFLPCYNAIILSRKNTLASFAAFCLAIDQKDTFAIRVRLHEASKRLDIEQEEGSASDYLRNLRNIRLLIKESLGDKGYEKYLDLILKSGTDRGRFIQELLQNADDCDYPQGVIPTFSLIQKENTVYTEYNEVGFNRANIRSITAIGESTKNKLFNDLDEAIGEKGVGFKTIFAVASKVRIYSGEYSFSLAEREPTIPRTIKPSGSGFTAGTRMEIILKDPSAFPSFDEKSILELCLCLRKLRSIKIGDHTITIEDYGEKRTIIIDKKRQHIFRRFTHTFTVSEKNALEERRNGNRSIPPEQKITCFVAEKGGLSDYALYNGLPTKHRIKIPMVIDAPFALTTSREEIEAGSSAWNQIVRKELYSAIIAVIDELKMEEREKIFRFTKFVPRLRGQTQTYVNDISDCAYLTSYDFSGDLRRSEILPTFDHDVFEAPDRKAAFRYPEAANILFRTVSTDEYAGIRPASIIDVNSTDYEAALNAIGCETAPFEKAFQIISKHAERFIRQEQFRTKMYEFLQDTPPAFRERLKRVAIIPVYGKTAGSIEYICWKEDSIFVKRNANTSAENYFVLNENQLSKTSCERMFNANINEMNAEWEEKRYNDRLNKIIQGNDIKGIYKYLMSEYQSGGLLRNHSLQFLGGWVNQGKLPMKNELGDIVVTPLYLCDQPTGYFPTEMIQKLVVHKECCDFARFIGCKELKNIHYGDIDYHEMLSADDVESLLDDYFINSKEILFGFYRDGLLSDELIRDYGLVYLAIEHTSDNGEKYDFPSEPVRDRIALRNHVRKQWQNPVKIVSENVERSVRKGQNKDGSTFELGINDARNGALRIYTPEGTHKLCFCQMCHKVKPYWLIEVNNIEVKPEYYFPQLRIALCLECSKHFEYLRKEKPILASIKQADIQDEGKIDVRIDNDTTITFTARHLAEIQEIFRQMPNR